jgi:HEAT repeat protein
LEELVAASEAPDAETRRAAAAALGQRARAGDLRAIPVLIGMLSDAGEYVDEAASDALWSIGQPAVLPLMALLLDRTAPSAARMWAARSLTYIEDSRSAQPMLDVIQDPAEDIQLRRVLALYLGRVGHSDVLEPLLELVADPAADGEMRLNAAHALGELRDARAVEPLRRLLEGEDTRVMTEVIVRELRKIREMRRGASEPLASQLAHLEEQTKDGRSLHHQIRRALRLLEG